MLKEFKAKLLGKIWRIVPAEGLLDRYGVHGDCDSPGAKRKSIRYEPTLSLFDKIETICHECHHAAFPSTSEETVTEYNRDLRRILERALPTLTERYEDEESSDSV